MILLTNPKAGLGRAIEVAQSIETLLRQKGVTVNHRFAERLGDISRFAEKALKAREDCVLVCGGDGTLNEAVNVLAGSDLPLAVIPAGRGNDLARALKIPRNPKKIAEVILKGQTLRIDLGKANNRYFATIATLGFDAEVSRAIREGRFPVHHRLTYPWGILKLLRRYQNLPASLKTETFSHKGSILLAATANCDRYGGGLQIAPGAQMTDGLFHLCLIQAVSRFTVFCLFPLVYFGKHLFHPAVKLVTAQKVEVQTDRPATLFADGEPLAETPTTLEIVPKQLTVITGPQMNLKGRKP